MADRNIQLGQQSTQASINATAPGDRIIFTGSATARYDLLSDREYAGEANFTSTEFGFRLGNGTRNVTVLNLKIRGRGFTIGDVTNISFEDNAFSDMVGHAIVGRERSNGLKIVSNTFERVRGYGVWELYSTTNFLCEDNEYIDCMHGGHLLGPRDGVVIRNNHLTGLTDWGYEIQDSGSVRSNGMIVDRNVMHGYKRAYGNTGGLSVVNIGNGTFIRDNYIRADYMGAGTESHLHVAIELNRFGTYAEINRNVAGSLRTDGYVWEMFAGYEMTSVAKFEDNKAFGKFGSLFGGTGQPTRPWPFGLRNTWDTNGANMPGPPGTIPPPEPEPPDVPAPSEFHAEPVAVDGRWAIRLTWKDNSTEEVSFTIRRKTRDGNDPWHHVKTTAADATAYVDLVYDPADPSKPFPANWVFKYELNGNSLDSDSEIVTTTVQIPSSAPPPIEPPPVEPEPDPVTATVWIETSTHGPGTATVTLEPK